MMTSTALPLQSARGGYRQGALEVLVSRLAVSMLRWSQRSSERRLLALERSVETCAVQPDAGAAADYSRLVRHVRLG